MKTMKQKALVSAAALAMAVSVAATAGNLPTGMDSGTGIQATGASIQVTRAFTDCQSITVIGTVTFTGSTDDGAGNDTVYVELWDDGALKASWSTSLPVGSTGTVPFSITYGDPTVGTAAPGIGVVLYDLPGSVGALASIDPQDVEGEAICAGGGTPFVPVAVPLGGPLGFGLMGLLLAGLGVSRFRKGQKQA
ncbi:MAG: hypothetical protein ABIY56_11110 [Dokdonella sp.]